MENKKGKHQLDRDAGVATVSVNDIGSDIWGYGVASMLDARDVLFSFRATCRAFRDAVLKCDKFAPLIKRLCPYLLARIRAVKPTCTSDEDNFRQAVEYLLAQATSIRSLTSFCEAW